MSEVITVACPECYAWAIATCARARKPWMCPLTCHFHESAPEDCHRCEGGGWRECPECEGEGVVERAATDASGKPWFWAEEVAQREARREAQRAAVEKKFNKSALCC